MRRAVAAVVGALVVAVVIGAFSAGAGAAGEDGKALFGQMCAGCHTIGGGKLAGPDLQGLADRRDLAWVERFIQEPDVVLASGDPIAQGLLDEYGVAMPNLGVSDAQLAALVAYLGFEQQAPPPTETTPTEPAPAPSGDEGRGKLLFEGSDRFETGGPPCLSCHSVAGVGALGGGQLGPDLTGASARLGAEKGLAAWLAAIPSPTMAPIFESRPLTDQERADLAAFVTGAANAERESGQMLKLVGLAVGVALLVAFLASAIWQRKLGGVRRPLVDRARGSTP